MEITKFLIEESKVNKGVIILIAITEDGKKFVVSGDYNNSVALIPYEKSWDALGQDEYKKLTGY